MVKIRFAAFASMIVAALSLSALAQQTPAAVAGTIPDGKIVVMNTNAFPTQIGELKQKYDQVENQFKAQSQKIDQLRQQVAQKQNDIDTKGSTLAPDKLRDLQVEVDHMVAEGDLVACHITIRGRHTGELFGVPASQRDIAVRISDMVRFRNGKVIERWGVEDMSGLMS